MKTKLTARREHCPHCARLAPVGCITCTRSQCQEKEYLANRERAKPKRRSNRA